MTNDLPTRLLRAIQECEDDANRMTHDNPDDGGYYSCPATRSEPFGDLEYGEDACDCGMPAWRAEYLRFCQAHREIVEHWQATKNALEAAEGTILAGACRVRLGAYDNVLKALASAYGLEGR